MFQCPVSTLVFGRMDGWMDAVRDVGTFGICDVIVIIITCSYLTMRSPERSDCNVKDGNGNDPARELKRRCILAKLFRRRCIL